MARKLRIEFPGAIYHVMSRGDRREDIFHDDFDRENFIQTLEDVCGKTNWQVHAFCLLPNHFHLVVETPQPNLVAGMKWFLGTYTSRFNRRHGMTGHVFSGRYKSQLVGTSGGYLRTLADYVHLNPVRAGLLAKDLPILTYRWSSFPSYLLEATLRPSWLRTDRVLGENGIPQDSTAGRREFEHRLETRRSSEIDDEFNPIRSGWCFGDEAFRQELLGQMAAKLGRHHYGPEIQEAAAMKAQRIVVEELQRLGWSESTLAATRKGDPEKLAVAQRLRKETVVSLEWIANRLQAGTRGYLSHLLYWAKREKLPLKRKSKQGTRKFNSSNVPVITATQAIPLPDPDVFDLSFD